MLCSVTPNPHPENHAFYDAMWKNIAEPRRSQMTIWCMSIACWIPKAKNTRSYYVILTAFPQQKWLHECPSVLCYTYIAGLLLNLYTFCNVSI